MQSTSMSSAERVVTVLDALADAARKGAVGMTVSELARSLGRDKSVVSRQVSPMIELGLVERDDDGALRVGWRLHTIAAQAGDQRLLHLAQSVMRRLASELDERVHLSVRRGHAVLTVLTEGPVHAVEATNWVGHLSPMATSASGRALLFDEDRDELRAVFAAGRADGSGRSAPTAASDFIDRVARARDAGVAVVIDEFEDGLAAAGAPVRDPGGHIVAALNVSAPTFRFGPVSDRVGQRVTRAARSLSRAMAEPTRPWAAVVGRKAITRE